MVCLHVFLPLDEAFFRHVDVFLSMSSFPIIVRSLIRFRLAVAAEVPIVLVIACEEKEVDVEVVRIRL